MPLATMQRLSFSENFVQFPIFRVSLQSMAEQIFISYSKKDSDFAHKLADDLEAAGFKIWIDRSIGGGDLWRETIEKNLKTAGEVIIVVSPNSMTSEWVKHEGSLAYGWGKKLYPILIEKVEALPPWLEEYQWIDFVKMPHNAAFDSLVAALTPPNPIQDLLDQQVQVCRQTGDLIGEAILRVVNENRGRLVIDDEAQELISRSQQVIDERIQREQQLIAEKEEARRNELQKAEQIRQLELYVAQKKAEEAEEQRKLEEARAQKAEAEAKNLIIRARILRASLIVSVVAFLFAVIYLIRQRSMATVMDNGFNIAIAEFVITDQSGRVVSNSPYTKVDDALYSNISQVFGLVPPALQLEAWGPTRVGKVQGSNEAERALNAAKVAQRIHATILIYGVITEMEQGARLLPEIYLAQSLDPEIQESVIKAILFPPYTLNEQYSDQLWFLSEKITNETLAVIRGAAYYSIGDFASALELFLQAKDKNPRHDNENVYVLVGNTYIHLAEINNSAKDLETALEYFREAAAINPNNVWTTIGLAEVDYRLAFGDLRGMTIQQLDMERLNRAYSYYQQVMALAPDSIVAPTPTPEPATISLGSSYETIKAHFGLGEIHLARALSENQKRSEELLHAAEEFNTVIDAYAKGYGDLQNLACHAHARLGVIGELQEKNSEAEINYKQAVELCNIPSYKAIYSALLGDLYVKLGQMDQARSAYAAAIDYEPNTDNQKKYQDKLDSLK